MSSIHIIDTKHQAILADDIEKFKVPLYCSVCGRKLILYMQEEYSDMMEKTGTYKITYHHKESDDVSPVVVSIVYPAIPKLEHKYEIEKYEDVDEARKKPK